MHRLKTTQSLLSAGLMLFMASLPVGQAAHANTGACIPKPVPCAMNSRYGMRVHPVTGELKGHKGNDFRCAQGTPVQNVMDGRVDFSGFSNTAGNWIRVRSGVYEFKFMHHFRNIAKVGDSVSLGQELAKSGNTGRSTGPHLHFEVIQSGRHLDPGAVLCGESPSPVPPDDTTPGTTVDAGAGGGAAAPKTAMDVPERTGIEGAFWDMLANAVGSRALNPSYPFQLSTLDEVRLFEELNYLEGIQLQVSFEKNKSLGRMLHNRAVLQAIRIEKTKKADVEAQRETALQSSRQ